MGGGRWKMGECKEWIAAHRRWRRGLGLMAKRIANLGQLGIFMIIRFLFEDFVNLLGTKI